MVELSKEVNTLVRKHGITQIVDAFVCALDEAADFEHMSGNKRDEEMLRKKSIALFTALRKIKEIDYIFER